MAMRRRRAMSTGRRLPAGMPAWLFAPVILACSLVSAARRRRKNPLRHRPPPAGSRRSGPAWSTGSSMAGPWSLPTAGRCGWPGSRSRPCPTPICASARSGGDRGGAGGRREPRWRACGRGRPAALLEGRDVVLKHAKLVTDRYGRFLADAVVTRDGAASRSPKTLLAQGLARLAARPGEAACTAELRPAERTAGSPSLACGPIRGIIPKRPRTRRRSRRNGAVSRWSKARWCRCARAAARST